MINIKNLFLDFASNINGSEKRNYAFAPLEEQYSKLNIIPNEYDEFSSLHSFLIHRFFFPKRGRCSYFLSEF
jgi:hypothetical protein